MILLKDDIQKANTAPVIALLKLRKYLDTKEPELVRLLQSTWNNQQRAITYKELREAIMIGALTEEMLDEWRKDYSRFVVEHVAPRWKDAMIAANDVIERNGVIWRFNADARSIKQWTDTNAARFVTSVAEEQIKAIREVVKRAAQMQDLTVDELSKVIRPMIGLDCNQARANMNYYQAMIDSGVSKKKAQEKSIIYSARQNRQRGYRIARHELASAYGYGAHDGTVQAQKAGLLGKCKKKVCTADDERVCSICGPLDGTEYEMEEEIPFKTSRTWKTDHRFPPFHCCCRCTLLYIEEEPPTFAPEAEATF